MCAKPRKDKADPSASGPQRRVIAENRKAKHRFEILEQLECGIVLLGSEVKSLRENKLSLDEAYVRVIQGELWLVGADIAEYRQATVWNHDPKRPRKLLAQRRQQSKLAGRAREKGMTLVPLQASFNERGIAKIVVAVCRGKKVHDKRETIKAAEAKRSIDRALRRGKKGG
ncbi:MAG TPA: SsrA-binding protein SmpB [Pirellulaceae bacterium]|nr:SsrA-binding protein SmpB [Pirellulaceae bacterium]